ncbi:uncharacterized protein VTP21DRAFT_607 [Calcarisporiella thermophila]|uniref:uncharacterized protein n=1 Tax=Calcarisporiella thermophila TaxID=911321 RepID=UPI00374443DD
MFWLSLLSFLFTISVARPIQLPSGESKSILFCNNTITLSSDQLPAISTKIGFEAFSKFNGTCVDLLYVRSIPLSPPQPATTAPAPAAVPIEPQMSPVLFNSTMARILLCSTSFPTTLEFSRDIILFLNGTMEVKEQNGKRCADLGIGWTVIEELNKAIPINHPAPSESSEQSIQTEKKYNGDEWEVEKEKENSNTQEVHTYSEERSETKSREERKEEWVVETEKKEEKKKEKIQENEQPAQPAQPIQPISVPTKNEEIKSNETQTETGTHSTSMTATTVPSPETQTVPGNNVTVESPTPNTAPVPTPNPEKEQNPKDNSKPNDEESKSLANPKRGEGTWYTPSDSTGACGFDRATTTDNDLVAAISGSLYGPGDNGAPLCGRRALVKGPKGSVEVRIVDKCPPCAHEDIDLSPNAFKKIADLDDGRVPVTWDFI